MLSKKLVTSKVKDLSVMKNLDITFIVIIQEGERKQLHANRRFTFKDTNKGLELLGNWIIDIPQTQDEEFENHLLMGITKTLVPFNKHYPLNTKKGWYYEDLTDKGWIAKLANLEKSTAKIAIF
nr:7693_t:CDS:2 [Entrophospora candida]